MGPSEKGVGLGLTAAQSEFWLAHELSPGGSSNRIAQFVDLDGALDVSLMKRSVRQALDECEPMRCRFVASGAELRQIVETADDWELPVIDLSTQPDPSGAAGAWIGPGLRRPLDLQAGRLYEHALLQLGATRWRLFLSFCAPHRDNEFGAGRSLLSSAPVFFVMRLFFSGVHTFVRWLRVGESWFGHFPPGGC